MVQFLAIFFLLLHPVAVFANKHAPPAIPAQKWLTLSGERPVVIARGGFSGLFPDSSESAYAIATSSSLPDTVQFCDVQVSKDGVGFCQSEIRLDNSTSIASVYPKGQKTYNINGEDVRGWFAVDFTADQLFNNVTLVQGIYTRTDLFDNSLPLELIDDVSRTRPPRPLWLNVQYDMFYKQHNINVKSFIHNTLKTGARLSYISSPEIDFLKSLRGVLTKATKVVFRFLAEDATEPTTKKTYKSILADLASIKTFASGILVPKTYIWPVTPEQYLEPHTSLVTDAHKLGLEVYAYGFANDMPGSFNYSYDPTAEYLQFIDNSKFAVDGFLTDFPPTASEAIGCLALNNKTAPRIGKTLVISHNGASGVFPPCTDLAYQQAVNDGADIIDCSVQLTKDGLAFCADSADLTGSTTAATTFMSKSTSVPDIQGENGIFSFDLTWSEIQSLKPLLLSPTGDGLPRNPANKNAGKLILFSEFLELARTKAVSGVLINIKNAAILAKKGFDVTEVVSRALANATLDKQSTQQVLIQSDDTSVLAKYDGVPTYKRVLNIVETISNVTQQSVDGIKKFADVVVVNRPSAVVTTEDGFSREFTNVVTHLRAANLTVYITTLTNEFTSIPMDFFSDPILEISIYALDFQVDGLVTDYPATANAFLRCPCADPNATNLQYTILPPQPGGILSMVAAKAQGPAQALAPTLELSDVVDPPLPPVAHTATTTGGAGPANGKNGRSTNVANVGLCLLSLVNIFMVLI